MWDSARTEGQPDATVARTMVDGLAQAVSQNRTALLALTTLKNYDNYTFTHMVNVSILTMGQARALGIDGSLLREFGLAALMHDIGKVRTPLEILNKPDKLTDAEFSIMKRHTVDGAEILRATPDIPALAPVVAFEHHLRLDGTGYPTAVKRPTLNLGTMLCSIADVYDAMRSQRSYQQSFPSDRILEVLKRNDGLQFDQHLVRRFVQLVGIYPAGNLVRLDTRRTGGCREGLCARSASAAGPRHRRSDRRAARRAVRRQPVGEPARRRTAQRGREGNRLRRARHRSARALMRSETGTPTSSGLESHTVRIATAVAMLIASLLALPASQAGGTGLRGDRVAGQADGSASPPRLVVFLVVDQMRGDYVDRFRSDWTRGLKRLLDQGAWFSRAAYPYLTTVTCAGHATVSTGAFPRTNGIFQNAWYDRESGRPVTCTEDSNVRAIGYGVRPEGGDSGHWLLLPTLADEMRTQHGSRVVTLSLKPRSAIMLAGRAGDAVTWLTASLDGWQTSSAFSPAPVAAVQQFVNSVPIAADYGKSWTPLLEAARYHDPDAGESEEPPAGWTASFPHVLNGAGNRPDNVFLDRWEQSPFADAYLGRFAAALVESLNWARVQSPTCSGSDSRAPTSSGTPSGRAARKCRTCMRDSTKRSASCSIDSTHWSGGTTTSWL